MPSGVGYIKLYRKLLESESFSGPPLKGKLFVWMLLRANFKDHGKIKRGELLTSIKDMQDAMSWDIGWRKMVPTKAEIRKSYEGLRKDTTISTRKTTRGMIITILNYDDYQVCEHNEGHTEEHNEILTKDTGRTHYKGRKGIKEEGKDIGANAPLFPSGNVTPKCPHKEIIDAYHEILPSLPVVKVWNPEQQKILRARWNEDKERQSLDWWRSFFRYVSQADHLMGMSDSGWTADMEWLVRPKNFAKIANGVYHKHAAWKGKVSATTARNIINMKSWMEEMKSERK